MIITILAVLLLIIGILLTNNDNDLLCGFGFFGVLVGGVTSFILIVCVLCTQIGKEINYQNTLYEKEVLEYRIENMEEDIIGNEMLYNDIVEFNNTLRSTKKWANNPWTNWFNNDYIASIDYIEFGQ